MSKKDHKPSKMKNLFKGFRKSTTDLSEWSKNDDKLMKAVEGNDLPKVDELLRKKSLNPTKLGPKGLSVFHVACTIGLKEVVNLLIQHGAEVNVLSIQGNTSVQIAARDGHPDIVEKLIEAGGVIDHKDGMSLTALHHACVRGKLNCVQVLLKHGADPNSRDKTGKPPLFYAAYSEDLPICKELVDKGAQVNANDEQQLTPLMAAAKKGSVEICEFLLKKGADPKYCDMKGHDALSYGLDSGFENLREVFDRAPTQAAWSVNQEDTPNNGPAKLKDAVSENEAPVPEIVVEHQEPDVPVDKENMVNKFVPESTPEMVHKQAPQQRPPAENAEEETDEETLAQRAASPPQAVIDQRTLEAYKELEEENEHMNLDLKKLTGEHKRLQEAYNGLKKQLSTPAPPPVDQEEVQELEDELSSLKSQLTEEQDKNVRLIDKMQKVKKKFGLANENGTDSGDDSWNDSDDELFEPAAARKPMVIDHKPQTLLLLQNQVAQLRLDNKKLRERLQTGSMSSLASLEDITDVDRLRRRMEDLEADKQRLQKQLQENNVFPEDHLQNVKVLEEENTKLHTQLKQLRTEMNSLKQSATSGSPVGNSETKQSESAITEEKFVNVNSEQTSAIEGESSGDTSKENLSLKAENTLLTEELESLRETYSKLVVAGDNLQEVYDQLVQEKQQLQTELEESETVKQQLAKENEYLLDDGMNMHADIDKLVVENEKLQQQSKSLQTLNEELEKKVGTLNQSGKASDFARVVEERDKLIEKNEELAQIAEELKQNHDVVLEEVQSLQSACQRAEYERDQIQQEFDSLQDEFESVQVSCEGLQQDYSQLEQDYSDLLADKEKLEGEFLEVQTASVNVEHHNPVVVEERDRLQQENEVLVMEKEQLEMTTKELSKSNALVNEELTRLKQELERELSRSANSSMDSEKLSTTDKDTDPKSDPKSELKPEPQVVNANGETNATGVGTDGAAQDKVTMDSFVEKDRRIRSLQIQISRLQQQLADADRHYKDVISTYRTHLLSAVQGHMDPDVKQALYNIIELRSMEQFC